MTQRCNPLADLSAKLPAGISYVKGWEQEQVSGLGYSLVLLAAVAEVRVLHGWPILEA